MYKDDDLLFLQRDQFDESLQEETYFSWSFVSLIRLLLEITTV